MENSLHLKDIRSEDRCKIEFIRHACLGQSNFWVLIVNNSKNKNVLNDLKPLLKSKPPNQYICNEYVPNPTYFRLNIYNFLSSFLKIDKFEEDSYYLLEFKQIKKKWVEILYPIFENQKNPSGKKPFKICLSALNSFYKKKPALFRSLNKHVMHLLESIGPKIFIPTLGLDAFEMIDYINPSFLEFFQPSTVTQANIAQLLGLHNFLLNNKVSTVFQSLFACGEPFPSQSKLFKEDNVLTLTNDSLLKKKHFFDIVFDKGQQSLISHNFHKVSVITEKFPELRQWILLTEIDNVIAESGKQVVEDLCSQFGESTMPMNIMNRFINDTHILQKTELMTGIKLTEDDFVTKSIPYIMRHLFSCDLSCYEDFFNNLANTEMFLVSDIERSVDVSFFYAYMCISNLLEDSVDVNKISRILSRIENQNEVQKLVVELFSVLFLQGKRFPLEVGQNLISEIIPYADKSILPFLSSAMSKMQFGAHLGMKYTNECYFSAETISLTCLKRKEFDLCEKMANNNKKLLDIARIAKQLYIYSKGESVIISQSIKERFNIEKSLSFGQCCCEVDEKWPSFLKKVLSSRKDKTEEEILSFIVGNVKEDAKIIENAFKDSTLISSIPDSYCNTKNFIAFHKLCNNHPGKTISEIVADITNEKMLGVLLGTNAIEKMLATGNGNKIIKILEEEYPLVANALKLEEKQNKPEEKEEDVLDCFSLCTDEKRIKEELNNFITERSIDDLIDLRIMYPKIFEDADIISKIDLQLYIEIFPEKCTKLLQEVSNIGISTTNNSDILIELLEKEEFILAFEFSDFYNLQTLFKQKVSKIIKENYSLISKFGSKARDILLMLPPEEITSELKEKVFGIENIDDVKEIATKYPNIDLDTELLNYVTKELLRNENVTIKSHYAHFAKEFDGINSVSFIIPLIKLFKRTKKVSELISNRIISNVQSLYINSVETEDEVIKILRRASRLLKNTKFQVTRIESFNYEPQLSKIDAMFSIFSNRLFNRFSMSFGLQNFQSEEYGEMLNSKCGSVDIDVLNEVNSGWVFNMSQYLLEKFKCAYTVGDRIICSQIISREKTLGRKLPSKMFSTVIKDFSFPLSFIVKVNDKKSISSLDKKEIDLELHSEVNPIKVEGTYSRACNVTDDIVARMIYNDQAIILSDLIETFCKPSEYISFCSSCGMLESAFKAFSNLPPSRKNPSFAVKNIVFPALSNGCNTWNKFARHVNSYKETFPIDDVIEYLKIRGLFITVSNLFMQMKYYDKAALLKIQVMLGRTNYQEKLKDLTFIVDALTREGNKRAIQRNATHEYKEHSELNDEVLIRYTAIAGFDASFAQMCIDENIPFYEFDLFSNNPNEAINMAILALIKMRFNLCVGICDVYTSKRSSEYDTCSMLSFVIQNAMDKINDNGNHPENISLYLEQMNKKADSRCYNRIIVPFVKCIYMKALDRRPIPKFILTYVKGIPLQIEIMLLLGFYNEAIEIAEWRGTKTDLMNIEQRIKGITSNEIQNKVRKAIKKKRD